ncbi:hypothetical protein Tco_0102712 [Tanacetum coccineum]
MSWEGVRITREVIEKLRFKGAPMSFVKKRSMEFNRKLELNYEEGEVLAPTVFMDLMNQSKEEHKVHLKLMLESLRKEKLYANFSKYAEESVRDAIGFEFCLESSSGWTKSPVLWVEFGESSLSGLELV